MDKSRRIWAVLASVLTARCASRPAFSYERLETTHYRPNVDEQDRIAYEFCQRDGSIRGFDFHDGRPGKRVVVWSYAISWCVYTGLTDHPLLFQLVGEPFDHVPVLGVNQLRISTVMRDDSQS